MSAEKYMVVIKIVGTKACIIQLTGQDLNNIWQVEIYFQESCCHVFWANHRLGSTFQIYSSKLPKDAELRLTLSRQTIAQTRKLHPDRHSDLDNAKLQPWRKINWKIGDHKSMKMYISYVNWLLDKHGWCLFLVHIHSFIE